LTYDNNTYFVFLFFPLLRNRNDCTTPNRIFTSTEKTADPHKNADISVPIELEFGLYPYLIFSILPVRLIFETPFQKQTGNEIA